MNKKSGLLLSLLFLCLFLPAIKADVETDFDAIVDFSINLKDFYIDPGNTDSKAVTDKIVLLDGTLSVVYPVKAYGFLYEENEIMAPAQFIKKFENPNDNLTRFLAEQLSSKTKKMLGNDPEDKVLTAVLKDINGFIRKDRLYAENLFAQIKIPDAVKMLLSIQLQEDEQAFVNRLLMDIAFAGIVKQVEIQAEIINGVWYGYERVESYIGRFRFKGAEAFKIFIRADSLTALSGLMISLNSRIMIAARPLGKAKLAEHNKDIWMFDAIYVRTIK